MAIHIAGDCTPAQAGVLGIILGPWQGWVGEGSLGSASRGAGRAMSRTRANATFDYVTVSLVR